MCVLCLGVLILLLLRRLLMLARLLLDRWCKAIVGYSHWTLTVWYGVLWGCVLDLQYAHFPAKSIDICLCIERSDSGVTSFLWIYRGSMGGTMHCRYRLFCSGLPGDPDIEYISCPYTSCLGI